MALVREILRSELRGLTLVSYGGADVGMLCAADKLRKLVFAFVSLDFIPLEPYFRQARQSGSLEVMEIDEGLLLLGLRAAAWRLPYIPTQVGLSTDIVDTNPEIKLVDSPYDDREWLAMSALRLDAALLHVDHADSRGVCQISGPDHYMDDMFARAAQRTYVSCDELVDSRYFHAPEQARLVFWERAVTTGVAHIPGGCTSLLLQSAVRLRCAPFQGIFRLGQTGVRVRGVCAALSGGQRSGLSSGRWRAGCDQKIAPARVLRQAAALAASPDVAPAFVARALKRRCGGAQVRKDAEGIA